MQMLIPEIGTKIKLTKSWIFLLNTEYRNSSIFDALGENKKNLKEIFIEGSDSYNKTFEMFLPEETILSVKRIYIRNGKKDYSSVTFSIQETSHPFLAHYRKSKKKKIFGTFWAKLSDVNKIECEVVEDTQKVFKELIAKKYDPYTLEEFKNLYGSGNIQTTLWLEVKENNKIVYDNVHKVFLTPDKIYDWSKSAWFETTSFIESTKIINTDYQLPKIPKEFGLNNNDLFEYKIGDMTYKFYKHVKVDDDEDQSL